MNCTFHELIEPAGCQNTSFDAYQRLINEGKPAWINDEPVPEGRAEMKVMLEQIIPRMQNLHLLSRLERIQSAELTAARSMRVGFDPV